MRGCVTQKGKRWYVVVDLGPDAEGGRQRKWHSGYATKKAAEDALPGILDSLQKGTYVEPSKLTVGEYLTRWLRDYAKANVSGRTFERYTEIIEKHLVPALGAHLLAKLQPLHVQAAYAESLASGRRARGKTKGLSAKTVLHHHRLLRGALHQAVKWQLVVRNVCDAVEPPRPVHREMAALDETQARGLLAAAQGTSLHGPVALALASGLRRGELLALRWGDVDLDGGTLRVAQALEQTKAGGVTVKAPKTPRSRRTVALPSSAVELLRKHRAKQAEVWFTLGKRLGADDFIFARLDGRLLDPHEVSKAFSYLARKAKLPGVTFHSLRHAHATLLLKAGVGVRVVADRLGHSSAAFTLATYGHTLAGQDQEAAAKLDAALAGRP